MTYVQQEYIEKGLNRRRKKEVRLSKIHRYLNQRRELGKVSHAICYQSISLTTRNLAGKPKCMTSDNSPKL